MSAVKPTEGEEMGVVGADPRRGGSDRGLRLVRDGDIPGNIQPDGNGVRDGVSGDREFRGAVEVVGRPVGRQQGREAVITDRQQRIHWMMLHLADLLVIFLLVGIIFWIGGVL